MKKICCLFPLPFDKIIFPRNADLYPAYKHDNQTRGGFCLVCATGPFHWARGFSEKRVKCFWRIVGPARRLTLPLQKGDWTSWVSLPAEPTFGKLPLMRPALGRFSRLDRKAIGGETRWSYKRGGRKAGFLCI